MRLSLIFFCAIAFSQTIPCFGISDICNIDTIKTKDTSKLSKNVGDTLKSKTLNEVVISADLNKQVGNKDVITVTKSMREGTHDTGELLGKVPGAFYNTVTTEVIFRGSKNIIILVDGVQKDESYIKRLRPDRFDKIEITNNPTGIYADYDAVIDLHTKPLYTGYEGVVLTEAMMSPGGRNGHGKFLRNSRNEGQFTYTRGKFNIDFLTTYTFAQEGFSDYTITEYPLNGIIETPIEAPFKDPNKTIRGNNFSADLSLDYEINRNHSVSARFWVKPTSFYDNFDKNIIRTFTNSGITDIIHENQKMNDKNRMDIFAGLWYRGKIAGWKLNANATYTHIGYDKYRETTRSSGFELIDNRKILSKYFSGGIEANRRSSNKNWLFSLSDNVIFTKYNEKRLGTDKILSASSDFRNTFNASVQFQGSKKFSASANAGFTIFRNSYNGKSNTHVTPKLGTMMMWTPSNKAFVRFNYTLSTTYPALSVLQDYGQFTDSLIYTVGNPDLKTGVNHNISLSATFFNQLTIDVRFNHRHNSVFKYYSPEEGEIPSGAYTYYTRIGRVNGEKSTWSINLTYNKSLGSHWVIGLTGTAKGYRSKYNSDKSTKVLPEYSWYVVYQTMKGTLRFILNGFTYHYNTTTPQINQWYLDEYNVLAVHKYLLNGKLELVAFWYMPFNFSDGKTHGGINSESYKQQYIADNLKRRSNSFRLAIVYKFNGGKSVKKYKRQSKTVEL